MTISTNLFSLQIISPANNLGLIQRLRTNREGLFPQRKQAFSV